MARSDDDMGFGIRFITEATDADFWEWFEWLLTKREGNQMEGTLGPLESRFIDEVADWLLATKDPRLLVGDEGKEITDVIGACKDFCRFMELLERRGFPASEWRDHV